ncbi:MAG TPA: PPE family protein, partial [Mycobacterium sp.]|nr:PPE family protein [Mycobacterium sp.]
MSFLVAPPEITSALMHAGAGSAPMLDAAAAWDGLASELGAAASSFNAVTSGLTGQAWQGLAANAMTAAATPYTGWLSQAASQASGAATQARAVASTFESALAATVHPALVQANRTSFVRAVMSNWFGLNAPAIAAFEGQYEEMWAQDVAAMVGYHGGASAAASALTASQGLQEALQGLPSLGGQLAGAANAVPALGLPGLTLPGTGGLPGLGTPGVGLPGLSLPGLGLPGLSLPGLGLPGLGLGGLNLGLGGLT